MQPESWLIAGMFFFFFFWVLMDEEIQYKSNPGMTQRFLAVLGARRGGVVCINTPFALFGAQK